MKKWTPERVAIVDRLYKNGLTYSQIACNIGIDRKAVQNLIQKRVRPCIGDHPSAMAWRVRQLLTAGFTTAEVVDLIGAPRDIVKQVFAEVWG